MRLLSFVPLPVVAAQVCIVAIRMINFEVLTNMYYNDKTQFANAMTIGVICCLKDPITAVVFGMLIYLALFCENLMSPYAEIIASQERDNLIKESSPNFQNLESNLSLIRKPSNQNQGALYDKIFETLENHLCDVPIDEGDYIIYRIIGVINFLNVNEHIEKIIALSSKENSTIVISLRYMNFLDLDALHAIKLILDKVKKDYEKRESQKIGGVVEKCKIMISGISKSKLSIIKDEEWIQKLKEENALIYNEHSSINRPSLLKF